MNNQDSTWNLTPAQLREFYETEKALAARLRNAPKADRLRLYQEVYNELYLRVPYHPMLTRKAMPEERVAYVARQMHYLSSFLKPDMTVLEIGVGDCSLSFEIARRVRKVYGVEVSKVITAHHDAPANFELVFSDGTSIPVPDDSIDLAYSDQLMEHLHPDDAVEQLHNIFRALRPGGVYLCRTPHRLQGPGDVSQFFDDVATCFHMKEYTYAELDQLFHQAGFVSTAAYVGKSSRWYRISMRLMRAFETLTMTLFGRQPYKARQTWLRRRPFTFLQQGINIVGYKA
jgi:SAM-dependent methyltransferase